MNLLKSALSEILGLFVDDVWFAVGIVIWIATVWIASTRFPSFEPRGSIILFVGLGAILLGSTVVRSRRSS